MGITMEKIILGMKFISQLDTFPIFCAYILMLMLAPQWKKITSPLNLRPVLVVYNLTASVVSVYTMCGFFYGMYQSESSFEAKPMPSLKPVFRVYAFVKVFELLDTVFMILRHRQRQISFLHVYHHSSMLILSDIGCNYYPYPAMTLYLGLNSAVHVVLYLYYGLSALNPDKPPQWKKFLTQFQILQFLIDLVHATIGYIFYTYCIYGIFYGLTMLSLFSNFYYKAYVRKPKSKSNQGISTEPNGNTLQNGYTNGASKKIQ